jgi:hypothetical protein
MPEVRDWKWGKDATVGGTSTRGADTAGHNV